MVRTMNQSSKIAIIALVVVVASLSGVYLLQLGTSEEVTDIIWQRTGGFIGLNEEMVIAADGSVSYTSDKFGAAEIVLTEDEIEELLNKADFITNGTYTAKQGVADFYIYRLTLQTASGKRTVEWVDDWASRATLPNELTALQLHLESVVERAHQKTGASQNVEERVAGIAKDFVVQAPTFKFDGITETLRVLGVVTREIFPLQHVITITFDSRHAGYGNRTGQVLAQVITPHTAEVTVVNDNVVSAILDDQWDELKQELIPTGEQQLTISGTISIGPLCPVEPCPDPQPDIYSSREVILQPEVGNAIHVKLSSDGSFQAKVKAGTYTVDLTDCIFLGCESTLPITVIVEPSTVITVNIIIDTGIR
jgi:hypothetical protein